MVAIISVGLRGQWFIKGLLVPGRTQGALHTLQHLNTAMLHLVTGMPSDKSIIGQLHHAVSISECASTNPDSLAQSLNTDHWCHQMWGMSDVLITILLLWLNIRTKITYRRKILCCAYGSKEIRDLHPQGRKAGQQAVWQPSSQELLPQTTSRGQRMNWEWHVAFWNLKVCPQ